jgi:ADP-heptose:LPS heptosyltransferase
LAKKGWYSVYKTNNLFKPALLFIDLLGYGFFGWLQNKELEVPKRILLIRLEHIGDVLLATPAFRALRKKYPKARIDVLCREAGAEVLVGNKDVDKVIVWNAPWLSAGKKESWQSVSEMIKKLRANKYDLAIDFHGDPRNILLAWLVADYRIGYGCRGLGFLLNKNVEYEDSHAIDKNLKLVDNKIVDKQMQIKIDNYDLFITSLIINKAKMPVVISAMSGVPAKNWNVKNWIKLAGVLSKNGFSIFLTGTRAERGVADRIRNKVPSVVNLCGFLTIKQLAALIKQSKMCISIDSAPLHIARAVNTSSIGIFLKEDPKLWGYDELNHRSVFGNVTVETVLEALEEIK